MFERKKCKVQWIPEPPMVRGQTVQKLQKWSLAREIKKTIFLSSNYGFWTFNFCFLALVLVATLPTPERARRLFLVLSPVSASLTEGVSSRERRLRLASVCGGEDGPARWPPADDPPLFPLGEFGRDRVFMVGGASVLRHAEVDGPPQISESLAVADDSDCPGGVGTGKTPCNNGKIDI